LACVRLDLARQITAAANNIDARLQRGAHDEGESREDGTRVMFEFPLGVQFEIDDEDQVVWVLHVWRVRR
jgi:hypothetical protein